MHSQYNPKKIAEEIEKIVVKDTLRKYYRVARPGQWYGGIATSDYPGRNCIVVG